MKDKPATEYALLGSLMSGPRHGYEILQFLETGIGAGLARQHESALCASQTNGQGRIGKLDPKNPGHPSVKAGFFHHAPG